MADKLIWSIDKLKNWDKNPRSIDKKDYQRLKNQIQKLGQYKPLIITPDGTVLGGNMRLRTYKDLGVEDIWVSIVKPESEAQMLEYALSDNDRAGYYNEQELEELVYKYQNDINLEDYAVDLKKFTYLNDLDVLQDEVIEDEAPPLPEKADSKRGEVYELGRHRLMCGDATKTEDVEKLMDGQKADMVFTDPPYALFGNSTGVAGIADDKMIRPFFRDIGKIMREFTELNAHLYSCLDWKSFIAVVESYTGNGLVVKNVIIWDKCSPGLGANYMNQCEWIVFLQNQSINKGVMKQAGNKTIQIRDRNVWQIKREKDGKHNAQKPLELCERAITNSSKEENIVLDLFGGSGSTLIACEQTNRECRMMEISEAYCDVIRTRYNNFTGNEPH
jgi:DNA modification methylase